MSKLVGFTGVKGSGKDTAGQFLVEVGFTRVGFADKLKEAVANLFDIDLENVVKWKYREPSNPQTGVVHLDFVEIHIDVGGDVEHTYTWREFLQRFGTEMARNTFGQDFWVELALPTFPRVNTVFTDVRFDNEAGRILKFGGKVFEIIRPGYESDGHASEEPIDRDLIDGQIINDGSLNTLKSRVLMDCLR